MESEEEYPAEAQLVNLARSLFADDQAILKISWKVVRDDDEWQEGSIERRTPHEQG